MTARDENTLIAMMAELCRAQCDGDSSYAGYLLLISAAMLLAEADVPTEEAMKSLSENLASARHGIDIARSGGMQ